MSEISALSLWQPWATLVVLGAKRIETRHWLPPASLMGERLAIHATLRQTELGLANVEPFRSVLVGRELPLGALVGHVIVDDVEEMSEGFCAQLRADDPREYAFGNYAPGRFAWRLSGAHMLRRPVPWRGHQSLFSVPAAALGVRDVPAGQGTLL